mgnify:FL=1
MSQTNYDNVAYYGLDIGGTKMEIGLFDEAYSLIESWRVPTPTDCYQTFLACIKALISDADKRCTTPGKIGIGMPGIIDAQGLVKSANVPCATGHPIKADLTHMLKRDIAIANDCQLFALSECHGGAGDAKPVVYGAIIGTGAGGGLCINGKLLQSKNNVAGEYGHLPVSAALTRKYNLPIRHCGCGLTGCAESYIAGPGLAWLYKHFGGLQQSTSLFVAQLRDNDAIAKQTFDCYIDLLGASIATLTLSYDPDVIVIGGGLSKIDEIIEALPQATQNHVFSGIKLPLITHARYGDSSGVRGAAILGSQDA